MGSVTLFCIATGKYDIFIPPLLESAEKYFLPNMDKKYVVLTDKDEIKTPIKHKILSGVHIPFPGATLYRYHWMIKYQDEVFDSRCFFYIDADTLFCNTVDKSILPSPQKPFVATHHPGYPNPQTGDWETSTKSLAYLKKNEISLPYVYGAFSGGLSKEYMCMADELVDRINADDDNDVVAKWHDESHWNKYVNQNKDKVNLLGPNFVRPEEHGVTDETRIMALKKNHAEIRNA